MESIDPVVRSLKQLEETIKQTHPDKWVEVSPNQLKSESIQNALDGTK